MVTGRHWRPATIVAALALLGTAAVAHAASLQKGLWLAGTGESSGTWTVVSNTKLSKVTAKSNFKCNRMNAVIPGSVTIGSDRHFKYSGNLKGQPGHIVLKGRFVSSTKAVGTTVITKGSCSSGTIKWTAKPLPAPTTPPPSSP